jgi:hypothetical protein
MIRYIYLHGFASSPQSSKAQFFRRQFAAKGIQMEIPPLDGGDFTSLTVSGQLAVVEQAAGNDPVIVIGSSLGGYVAALFAARHPTVQGLVLLAPALKFPSRFRDRYPPEDLARWKRDGTVPIFHYGYGEERPLSYSIVEDAGKYEDLPQFSQPALILHGIHDDVVPVELSRVYAYGHPNVVLREFESGHELTNVLEVLWRETEEFLHSRYGML